MKLKKLLSCVLSVAMVSSMLVIPQVAKAEVTPFVDGDTVINEWKFDFGSADDVAEGYTAVTPDRNQVTSHDYGFLGNDGNGHKVSDRTDSFSMKEGQDIKLAIGGATGLSDAVGVKSLVDTSGATPEQIAEAAALDAMTPIRFALKVDNGTYYRVRATVTGLDQTKDAKVTLFSEKRHPIYTDKVVPAGQSYTVDFSADVQTIYYEKSEPKGNYVDDLVNVVAVGENAAISSIEIQQVTPGKTLWVLGDSTVCDQGAQIPYFPLWNYAGVGQALSKYVPSTIAVTNHGEGGLNANDNYHFNNVKNNIKAGDYMFVEYGHNHKDDGPTGYKAALPKYYDAAHAKGAKLIVVGPIDRHNSSQYNSETNTWSSTLGGFSTVGKEFVEEKIAAGATDIAFVDLNKPSLDWMTVLTAETKNANITNFYFQTPRGGSTDGTHPNDAGIDQMAYMFFEEATKLEAAGVAVQSDVIRELVTDRSTEVPVPVSKTITDLGPAPNKAWPMPFVPPIVFDYPTYVDSVKFNSETGVLETMDVYAQAEMARYGRGIVAVFDENGAMTKIAMSKNNVDNTTGTGMQTLNFDSTLTVDEKETYRAYVWEFKDEEGYPLTMVPYSSVYVPTNVEEYLMFGDDNSTVETFEYYGVAADASLVGTNGWTDFGSAGGRYMTYKTGSDRKYAHMETTGIKGDGSAGSSMFYKKLEGSATSGKVELKFDVRYNSGTAVIKLASGDPTKYPAAFNVLKIKDGKATMGSSEPINVGMGQWVNVVYTIDMDYGVESISINNGVPVTQPVSTLQVTDPTLVKPTNISYLLFDYINGEAAFDFDIANVSVAKLITQPLPNRTFKAVVKSDATDENVTPVVKGTVAIKDDSDNDGSVDVIMNSTATATATANEGYEFEKWTYEDGSIAAATQSVNIRMFRDVTLTAHFVEKVADPITYLYKEDFKAMTTSTIDWSIDSGNATIETDMASGIGTYLKHAPGSTSGNRSMFKSLDSTAQQGGQLVLQYNLKMTQSGDRPTQFAVVGKGVNQVAKGYHFANSVYTFTMGGGQSEFDVSPTEAGNGNVAPIGSLARSSGYAKDTWMNVVSVMDFEAGTVKITAKSLDNATTYLDTTVAINTGVTAIGGFQITTGRGSSAVSVDNIKLYTADQLPKE